MNIQDEMNKVKQMLETPEEETVLPFGKHAGQSIEDIPNDYLKWFVENICTQDEYVWLERPIVEELQYRNKFNIKL